MDVGGGGGGGGGRVSSSTEPIQTRNLSYQFLLGGVAKSSPVRLGVRYINAIQKFCRPRRGRARVSTASRGSHRHHRRPTTPTIISLSLSLDRDFRRLLVRVYPDYVAEYTSGRVFASFLSSRRVSFRPVNCACPTPLPRPLRARGVISPRGGSSGVGRRCVEEDRSTMDDESVRLMFFLTTMMMIMERRPREGLIFRRFIILVSLANSIVVVRRMKYNEESQEDSSTFFHFTKHLFKKNIKKVSFFELQY